MDKTQFSEGKASENDAPRPLTLVFKKRAFSISRKITIGRDASNDIVLADDPLVSRRHAAFERESDGVYYIYDANSRNGTYVNGQPLPMGTKASLHEGDVITVGKTNITVGVEGS